MKAENNVCRRELAQKLVELGVRSIDSLYFYMVCGGMNYLRPRDTTQVNPCDTLIPAWTVAELGEMLSIVEGPDIQDALSVLIAHQGLLSHAEVKDALIDMLRNPDLCARVLIWLLENGHVMVEDINEASA